MADSVASFQLLTIDKYWGVKRCSEGHKYSCISLIVVPASKQRYVAALTLSFRQPTLNSERNLKGKNIFYYLNPVGCLKDNVNAATYRCFEAGTTINEIQEYLWPSEHRTTKHPEKYRVLENVTSGKLPYDRGHDDVIYILYMYVIIELLYYILNLRGRDE
jgi:hypothetical protein